MTNRKYVAKDCILNIMPVQDPNWLSVVTNYASLDWNSSELLNYYVRSATIESTTESIDATGVMQGIVHNIDGKFDRRITLSGLFPQTPAAPVNQKLVPKDIGLSIVYYDTTSWRGGTSSTAYTIATAEGLCRSIEITYRVNNVRVDGFGDYLMLKRPISVDGRCRIEGLLIMRAVPSDIGYNFLFHELNGTVGATTYPNRLVGIDASFPLSLTQTAHAYFTGGVSRVSLSIDNPLRQDVELVSAGYINMTAYTASAEYRPTFIDLFSYDSGNGTYASLAFVFRLIIPPFGTGANNTIIYGLMGVEELSLSVNEGEVNHSLSGTLYSTDNAMVA